jgi:hypothetical protein
MLRAQGLEVAASRLILTTTTDGTGDAWVQLGNANATPPVSTTINPGGPYPTNQIIIGNLTGTTLSFGYSLDGSTVPGETFEVPDSTSWAFRGINNLSNLLVRRFDESETQVTFKALVEGV